MKTHKNKSLNSNKLEQNNVYLSHLEQDEWSDLRAYHIENEAMWRNIAILSIFALLIVSIIAIYMVNQDKHKIIVFAKDDSGNLVALGLASKTLKVDNKIVAHQLVNFITALREVPIDLSVKRRNIDLIHKMVAPSLKAYVDQLLINQYSKAKNNPILVTVNNIKPISGGNSWIIDWSEQNNIDGQPIMTNWSSEITFKQIEVNDASVQIINPAGLFISYLHPTQDINEKGI